tara:strand:- start:991 stop:2028 length:1038 start_codon:yes stop_codon:yes gene_type:complete
MLRYVILAIGSFNYIHSKTGNMLIRYCNDEVVAIIDPDQSGKIAKQVLGWGGHIPCVSSFKETLKFLPTHLVIGSASQGGTLDSEELFEIQNAIDNGCNIISGMHFLLNGDIELVKRAKENGASLTDLRKPPFPPKFPRGSWKDRKFPVMLIVGSDCDTGKMTAAWELTIALKTKYKNVEFIGTGQTGILLSGKGVPIDAVVSDFMAGEIEYCLDQLPGNTDLAIVEGQGALNNMFYSGVTLGLLHGCMPDFLIMTHEPGRKIDAAGHPISNLKNLMDIHIDLLRPFKETKFLGINLLTLKLDRDHAIKTIEDFITEHNLPVTDIIRFNKEKFINEIEIEINEWN